MEKVTIAGYMFATLLLTPQLVLSEEPTKPAEASSQSSRFVPYVPQVELQTLLSEVSKSSKKKFLVDRLAPQFVTVGELGDSKVTYPILLAILRNNGMSAITIGGVVNVVHDMDARGSPLPIIYKDDPSILADEWVTRVVRLDKYEDGAFLIAALRPMMNQHGHMVWIKGENTILLVDRYANIQRLVALIEDIDKAAPSSGKLNSTSSAEKR